MRPLVGQDGRLAYGCTVGALISANVIIPIISSSSMRDDYFGPKLLVELYYIVSDTSNISQNIIGIH